eukprot:4095187-Pleurochrysis_carterae.AAC.1
MVQSGRAVGERSGGDDGGDRIGSDVTIGHVAREAEGDSARAEHGDNGDGAVSAILGQLDRACDLAEHSGASAAEVRASTSRRESS